MEQISTERLLNLTEDDLIVEDYYTDLYHAEAKLKYGLYAYWTGESDESYGRSRFVFSGDLKGMLILTKSYKEISSSDDDFFFTTIYLKYCKETNKVDKTSLKYLQMESIC